MNGLYVDPGVHKHAGAGFTRGELTDIGWFTARDVRGAGAVDRIVIEKPKVYPGVPVKDPNDLIDLAIAAGEFAGAVLRAGGPPVRWVFAGDWKGTVKKPIHHRRVWAVLTDAERERFAAACGDRITPLGIKKKIVDACARLARTGKVTGYSWAAHNLLDAVGLGLWDLGRLGRGGVRR